ncbi:MAG: EamA family transporter [Promethearchaeota archaeon]
MEFWRDALFNAYILMGLFSGLSYGLSIFFKKKIYNKRKHLDDILVASGNFDIFFAWISTFFFILIFFPFGIFDIIHITLLDLVYFFLFGLITTAIRFILYNLAIKSDKGGDIVVLSYTEPLVATINSVIFSQALSLFTIIGGALILTADIIVIKFSTKT